MGDLFNTPKKSLPGRSSMPLEGQFLCCALSVLAIELYKNFPQNVLVSSSFWSPRKRRHGPKLRGVPIRENLLKGWKYPWVSSEIFPWEGATSTYCLSFSGCWRCNANGRSQNALLFLPGLWNRNSNLGLRFQVSNFFGSGSNLEKFLAPAPKRFGPSKTKNHCIICKTRLTRDAGTGVHYGGTVPPDLWKGGNGGTGALTYQYHKSSNFMIYQDQFEGNLLQLFAHT